ncbi:MAG: hypothetical protein IPM42_09085 [Saprospiraceae bacterium]|nr:hypothetical protein [Saprospiraceae bacterium]
MHRIIILFVCALYIHQNLSAQQSWAGEYKGSLEGDQVILFLEPDGKDRLKGWMKDSNQKFDINAEYSGNRLAGTAVENTFGLEFTLLGELNNNQLQASLIFEFLGEKTITPFVLEKTNSNPSKNEPKLITKTDAKTSLPKDAVLDRAVSGTWTKNESYNSGYGDNFMGANFSQSLSFLPDGRVSEGGSSANMSGSYYSGNSKGDGKGVIEGLLWYTKGNQLYLQITEQGKTQEIQLGKYYIENNKMLITGANGEKLLLSR